MKLNFSPVTLFYVGLIIRPAKEPRREEGNSFSSLHMPALETSSCNIFDPWESRLMKKKILLTVPCTRFLPLRSPEKELSVAENLKRMSPSRRSEGSVLITTAA